MCVWDWERDYELVHAFVHAPVGLGSGEFMNVSFVGVGAVFGSLYACWCGALLFVWMLRQQGVMFMYIPFLRCVNVAATRGYVHVYPIPALCECCGNEGLCSCISHSCVVWMLRQQGVMFMYIPFLCHWGEAVFMTILLTCCSEFCWCLPPAVWLDSWMTLISTGEKCAEHLQCKNCSVW